MGKTQKTWVLENVCAGANLHLVKFIRLPMW